MLKSLSEESENRKPGAHDFADRRLRSHRHHYTEANHPVTEYRLYKGGEDTEPSELSVPQCLCVGDRRDFRGDTGGVISVAGHGHCRVEQQRIKDAPNQVSEKYP